MSNYTVYKHISPSNKVYIGITSQKPEQRWKNGHGYKGQVFYNAISKYGWDNIEHIIVAKGLSENEAKWLEIELIRIYDSTNRDKGYNITMGGEGANGYHHTVEAKKKLSDTHCGEKNHFFGKKHTEESKIKMSESRKGRVITKEQKIKTRNSMMGKNSGESNGMFGKCGKDCPSARMVICITTKKLFFSALDGGKYYNCDNSNIIKCCKGKYKTCGKHNGQKLVWRFINFNHNKRYRRLD